MANYVCDWCHRPKHPAENWVMAMLSNGSEAGPELHIAETWDEERSLAPEALHFCSPGHAERYQLNPSGAATWETETGVAAEIGSSAVVVETPRPSKTATKRRRSTHKKKARSHRRPR